MCEPIKIIIADDHEIFRKGFHVLLRKNQEIKIVADAGEGKDLIEKVKKHDPDVVITDIQMPEMDGVEAARKITSLNPSIGIIALTMFNDDNLIVDMLEAGAKGYLLKNTDRKELITAINAVHNGENYFCNATSQKMARLIALSRLKPSFRTIPQFSKNEIEIIKLMCQEYTSKQIGAFLGYTTRTVENYREKIQEKIGAKNAIGVVIYAIKHQIYQP
jgi:DNA-binding NarL/FixJ family response regulator